MAEPTVAMPETEPMTQAVSQPEPHAVEATRPQEHYMAPPVDIYETPESLVVIADLASIMASATSLNEPPENSATRHH
jgi:HSP20 family molecular chaperone IbpA